MFLPNNHSLKKNLCVFLVVIFYLSNVGVNSIKFETVYVTVKNSLGPGIQLTAHCRSSEDDIGVHVLEDGQYFGWHFKPNIWGSTKFYCELQSPIHSGDYLLYKYRRDKFICGNKCDYLITPNGICLQGRCTPWASKISNDTNISK